MKLFRVTAESTLYSYLEVEAETEDEAYKIARETDGGLFKPDTDMFGLDGDWNITDVVEI